MFGHWGVNYFSKVECDGEGSCPNANIIIYWDNICGGPHWPWPNSHPSLCRNTFWKKEQIFNFLDTWNIRIGGRCSFPTNWSFFQFCFSPLLPRTCLRQKVAKKTATNSKKSKFTPFHFDKDLGADIWRVKIIGRLSSIYISVGGKHTSDIGMLSSDRDVAIVSNYASLCTQLHI